MDVVNINVRPLRDYIAVRPLPDSGLKHSATTTIIIPETVKERPMMGEVVAVGPGKTMKNGSIQPLDVSVGDKIMFSKHGQREITGSDLFLIQQASVVGFVD